MEVGSGREFDELYAQERSKSKESCRKPRERHDRQEMKDVERINMERIRDILRKRLKGEKSNSQYQQRHDMANYRSSRINHLSDKSNSKSGMDNSKSRSDWHLQEMRKKMKKPTKFHAKLRELSMSPRTKKKKELESLRSETTQEISSGDMDNSKKSSKTTLKGKPLSEDESKTGTESIKEDRSSWLFKSPKERKKQLLQQQLELRRQLREKMISLRRQKLDRNQKIAANKLLASPKRLEENLLTARPDDTSIARLDKIPTTHNIDQISSKSQGIKNKRKSYRTARNIVEEDLKKRLQQMDFKLATEKIPQVKSERSIMATSDRSSSGLSTSGNRSVSGSESRRELSPDRRMRHRKSSKRSQSQSQNQIRSDSFTADSIHITPKNQKQKQLKRKLAESGKEYLESEKIRVRRKLKNKKIISDERKKEPLKKIDNIQKKRKEQQNFTKLSKWHVKLEKKNQNQKEKLFKNKKNMKKESKKHEKSTKQSSKISSKILNSNNPSTRRSNQKSIKMHSTSSKDKKLKENKSMSSQKTTITQKSTESTTCADSSKSSEEVLHKSSRNPDGALNDITRSDINEKSDKRSCTSKLHSKRNQEKSKKLLNLITVSTKAVVSNKTSNQPDQPTQTSNRDMLQFRKKKLDSSSLSNKSSTSETIPENCLVNPKLMEKFSEKPKINHGKKLHWKKTTKSKSLERGLSSSSNGIYTNSSSRNSRTSKNRLKSKKRKNKSAEVILKTANTFESPKRIKKRQIWQSRKKGHKLDSNEGEILKYQKMSSNGDERKNTGNNKSVEAIIRKYRNIK